jgi:hypothetical protein
MAFKLNIDDEEVNIKEVDLNNDRIKIIYDFDAICKERKADSFKVSIDFYMFVPKTQQLFYYYVSEPTDKKARINFSYPSNKRADYITFFNAEPINLNTGAQAQHPKIELETIEISAPGNGIVFSLADKCECQPDSIPLDVPHASFNSDDSLKIQAPATTIETITETKELQEVNL